MTSTSSTTSSSRTRTGGRGRRAPLSAAQREAADAARKISETAKSVQFQLARAVTRRKFDPLVTALDPAAEAWDRLMATLAARLG